MVPVYHVPCALRLLAQGFRAPLHSQADGMRGVRTLAAPFITSAGVFLRPVGAWRNAFVPPPPLAALLPLPSARPLPIGRVRRPAPPCGMQPKD